MVGRLRVGKTNASLNYPTYPGFTQIVALAKTTPEYGELSPFNLRNEQGQILENVWQFSKVYPKVPSTVARFSSRSSRIVWTWPEETHLDPNGNPTPEYWKWREAGMNNPYPVRAPVGWAHLKTCAYALEKDCPPSEENPKLGYIEARKRIYLPIYLKAVIHEPKFHELLQRWRNGENLLIIDVDGPHQESMGYYKARYNVPDNFIEWGSVEATETNLCILLNDERHPFGHGYCLAWALQTFK